MRANHSNKYLVKLINVVRNTPLINILIILTVIPFYLSTALLALTLIQGSENTPLTNCLIKLLDVERRRGVLTSLAYTIGFSVAVWGLLNAVKRTQVMIKQSNLTKNTRSDTRFRDGILLMGNESYQIRIGGFKVLIALAHEDAQKVKDIQDILCGYICERTANYSYDYYEEPSPDIRELLNLMFLPMAEGAANEVSRGTEKLWDRTRRMCIKGAPQQVAHLGGVNMAGADLHNILFEHVLFEKANLAGANFQNAEIKHTNFNRANLDKADFRGASIKDTDFTNAILSDTLKYAKIECCQGLERLSE